MANPKRNNQTGITGIVFEGFFVIQDKLTCCLIGVDEKTGHPVLANHPFEVRFWRTKEGAERFIKSARREHDWIVGESQFQIKVPQ